MKEVVLNQAVPLTHFLDMLIFFTFFKEVWTKPLGHEQNWILMF